MAPLNLSTWFRPYDIKPPFQLEGRGGLWGGHTMHIWMWIHPVNPHPYASSL